MSSKLKKIFYKTPWLTIGVPIATLATQLDKPYSAICYTFSAFCTIMSGIYHVKEKRIFKRVKPKPPPQEPPL